MKISKIISVLIIMFSSFSLLSEETDFSAGIRLEAGKDGNYGATIRYRFADPSHLEGLILFNRNGFEFSALYEYQIHPEFFPENLFLFFGGGAHIGLWGEDDPTVFGPDGIVGILYSVKDLPMNFSLDWHPVYNIVSEKEQRMWGNKLGISVRYCF
ncbi:MAG: hypothetical protein PF637_12230 [Spirochaetes bacterium]|jgi:hypothetical protein|nr:hypothetical protein [Spirochaetota bacterium]